MTHSQKIVNADYDRFVFSNAAVASLSDCGVPSDYLASLREQIARSRGYLFRHAYLMEHLAVKRSHSLRARWSLYLPGLWQRVSDVRNPIIDISPTMVSLIRSRAPMWLAVDRGDGFAVASMHASLDREADARQWLATEFCAKAFQAKLKKHASSAHKPGMPPSKGQRGQRKTYLVRLLRTTLRVNWQDLSHLDDSLYRRAAALALDIREALLRAQSTATTGREVMADAVEDELNLITATREALAAPCRSDQ